MSDPHLDLYYQEGSNKNCGSYLCCRAEGGYPSDEADQAGFWGSYECDTPHRTLVNMLQYVRDEIQPDLFFWTGDNSAHNVWNNTNEEVTDYVINITKTIQEQFDGSNIKVFPIQGNHDTWPVNSQNFEQAGINIPIEDFKNYWIPWLGEETVLQFGDYGYYAKDLDDQTRIIGINTQTCNNMNWYLIEQRDDPGHMIAWFEN